MVCRKSHASFEDSREGMSNSQGWPSVFEHFRPKQEDQVAYSLEVLLLYKGKVHKFAVSHVD